MKTLEQVLSDIETSVAVPEVRECGLAIGEVHQQGDVYLHRVVDDWPRGKMLGTRQIAVGDGIGSRHVVEGDVEVYEGVRLPDGLTVPDEATEEDMRGPVVVVESACMLTHPKHAHFALDRGVYQVTYPFDFTTMRREQD